MTEPNGHDKASEGASRDDDDAGTPPPPAVAELAEACVGYAERAVGVRLDYEPETLPILDFYAEAAAAEIGDRPAAVPILVRAVGAYIGEVLRRRHNAWWHAEGDDPTSWELRFGDVYLVVNPFAFAYAALAGDATDEFDEGITIDEAEREDVAAYLASLPPVHADDYRRPSTRVEAVDTIATLLSARAQAQGLGESRFVDEDYD